MLRSPNAHLFINPVIELSKKVYRPVPQIDEEKCNFCKKCAEICRFKAIAVIKEIVLTFPDLADSCGGCVEVCPENAITETGRELGVIEIGHRNSLAFAHGRLRVCEAMSPPLIREVLHLIPYPICSPSSMPLPELNVTYPVIAAMKEADFVLMVTEPTPFGLHDLKLAVEAVKLLEIPRGLVINRSDIGDDGCPNICKDGKPAHFDGNSL